MSSPSLSTPSDEARALMAQYKRDAIEAQIAGDVIKAQIARKSFRLVAWMEIRRSAPDRAFWGTALTCSRGSTIVVRLAKPLFAGASDAQRIPSPPFNPSPRRRGSGVAASAGRASRG